MTKAIHCQQCQHWDTRESAMPNDPMYAQGGGKCLLTRANLSTPAPAQSRAVAEGDDGYYSWLQPRYDFACNQAEPQIPGTRELWI